MRSDKIVSAGDSSDSVKYFRCHNVKSDLYTLVWQQAHVTKDKLLELYDYVELAEGILPLYRMYKLVDDNV